MQDVITVDRINRLQEGSGESYAYAGIDEVGVGSIAGPMLAAVVVLRPDHGVVGLPKDSKKLMPKMIHAMAAAIEPAVRFAWIGSLDAEAVDQLGAHEARTILWQAAAVAVREVLPLVPIVIDGGDAIPGVDNLTAVPGADDTHDAVSAAAILAKSRSDRIMVALDRAYPGYFFAQQKGYGKPKHLRALQRLGPSPVHRSRMTLKAMNKSIPEEELELPQEDLQALLRDLAPLLKAHPEMASDWSLNFLRQQWMDVMMRGIRPSGRQQFFIADSYAKLTKIARKKSLVSAEVAEEHQRKRKKIWPSPLPLPAAIREPASIPRNHPCPCGSRHKYKKCCAPDAAKEGVSVPALPGPPSRSR